MSVSPDSSVSQRDVNSLAVDSRPFFPFEVFTQLDSMSPSAVLAVQSMYEAYCQACVSVAKISQVGSDGSRSSSGTTSSASSRPNRRQRRRASRQARSRGSSSMSQRSAIQAESLQAGYCYLALVKAQFRSVVQADLGFDPTFADLARLPIERIDTEGLDRIRFDRVSSGRWHCGKLGQYSVSQVMGSLRSVYCTVLGTFGSKFEASTDLQVSLSDRLGFLEPAVSVAEPYDWAVMKKALRVMVSQPSSTDLLVYSLEDPMLLRSSSLTLTESTVCRAQVHGGLNGDRFVARYEVMSHALTVAKCPEGARVELNGLLLGDAGSSVFVVFKGAVSFAVRSSRNSEYVDVPFMVGSHTLSKVVQHVVPSKSTSARFFRAQGGTAMLRGPRCVARGASVACDSVSITDPLQEWNAIQEDRFQGSVDGRASHVFRSADWQAVTAFRTDSLAKFVFNGVVQACDVNAVFIYDFEVRLDVSGSDGKWSFRRRYVADDYAVDGGGPSDSEFSDAL